MHHPWPGPVAIVAFPLNIELAERVGFEPTWRYEPPRRFRGAPVATTSVPLRMFPCASYYQTPAWPPPGSHAAAGRSRPRLMCGRASSFGVGPTDGRLL